MARQVYADNVDANGKAFDTVGENIRKGAREGVTIGYITPESFGAVGDSDTIKAVAYINTTPVIVTVKTDGTITAYANEELNGDFILNITYDTISIV